MKITVFILVLVTSILGHAQIKPKPIPVKPPPPPPAQPQPPVTAPDPNVPGRIIFEFSDNLETS